MQKQQCDSHWSRIFSFIDPFHLCKRVLMHHGTMLSPSLSATHDPLSHDSSLYHSDGCSHKIRSNRKISGNVSYVCAYCNRGH